VDGVEKDSAQLVEKDQKGVRLGGLCLPSLLRLLLPTQYNDFGAPAQDDGQKPAIPNCISASIGGLSPNICGLGLPSLRSF
jgi:hypothetical protein